MSTSNDGRVARELKLKPRFFDSLFDGYDVVSGSITMDDPDTIYHVREVLPPSPDRKRWTSEDFMERDASGSIKKGKSGEVFFMSIHNILEKINANPATPTESEGVKAMRELTADDVEWVVNDNAELGVKIGEQFFFLYKGYSLCYEGGTHDDGSPMKWRHVFKREFGECCHPWTEIERKQYGSLEHKRPVRMPEKFVGYFGEDESEWKSIRDKERVGGV